MTIGVLALQGAFAEHITVLQRLGVATREIRQRADLTENLTGVILPGGESTVMGKLLNDLDLTTPLTEAIQAGLPVLGTCAGMILLAKDIAGSDTVHIPVMDICVRRNAYGRQLGSFNTVAPFKGLGDIPMTFIRAPCIETIWGDVEPLATLDGKLIAARQGLMLATAFHPELTGCTAIHEHFLEMTA